MSARLFEPVRLGEIVIRNRIGMAPMCQYCGEDGAPGQWHETHYGARAIGGAGLIIVEATAVVPEGRISPFDLGIWKDAQIKPLSKIANFLIKHGTVPGIQLAHSGRKAATQPFGTGIPLTDQEGSWQPVAPSPIAWDEGHKTPTEMTIADIDQLKRDFVAAANRASKAGFQLLELHAAHGYLLHSFLSPITNKRSDQYGGNFAGRTKLIIEIAEQVRKTWPQGKPLAVRLSCTDWVEEGWTLDDSVKLAIELKEVGVDLIDCSSGGIMPGVKYADGPGWQVGLAARIKKEADIAVAAVGLITEPAQAEEIVRNSNVDIVLLGRELLSNPSWPYQAARDLNFDIKKLLPQQYIRAIPSNK